MRATCGLSRTPTRCPMADRPGPTPRTPSRPSSRRGLRGLGHLAQAQGDMGTTGSTPTTSSLLVLPQRTRPRPWHRRHESPQPQQRLLTAPPVASLSVSITSLPASVAPGANATLSATTSPGATCTPTITYHSGTVSKAQGLGPQVATSGKVSWTWKVGSSTGSGISTAEVTCTLGSDSKSASKTFESRDAFGIARS